MSYETLVHELEQMQHDLELATEENLKLKQKLEAIRTVIVDIFDKDTEYGDIDLCYDALIRIDKTIREADHE